MEIRRSTARVEPNVITHSSLHVQNQHIFDAVSRKAVQVERRGAVADAGGGRWVELAVDRWQYEVDEPVCLGFAPAVRHHALQRKV